METLEIKEGLTYSGARWKASRKVVEIKRHRGQEAVVHYIDQRTLRTGNAPLGRFAASANNIAKGAVELTVGAVHLTANEKDWLIKLATAPARTLRRLDCQDNRLMNGLVTKGMATSCEAMSWTITDLGLQRCTSIC
ncbi:hypothetical protein [Herbaspirillum huttiense]|uniref:hypothetical protein n=1 Tax=Herbaspirillum huttiense TaxID=863372 RepID=UPI0039AFC9E9